MLPTIVLPQALFLILSKSYSVLLWAVCGGLLGYLFHHHLRLIADLTMLSWINIGFCNWRISLISDDNTQLKKWCFAVFARKWRRKQWSWNVAPSWPALPVPSLVSMLDQSSVLTVAKSSKRVTLLKKTKSEGKLSSWERNTNNGRTDQCQRMRGWGWKRR